MSLVEDLDALGFENFLGVLGVIGTENGICFSCLTGDKSVEVLNIDVLLIAAWLIIIKWSSNP